jgi:hypothetical protein
MSRRTSGQRKSQKGQSVNNLEKLDSLPKIKIEPFSQTQTQNTRKQILGYQAFDSKALNLDVNNGMGPDVMQIRPASTSSKTVKKGFFNLIKDPAE